MADGRDSSGSGIDAYATLLTRPNYLAGAILLAHTLHKYSPSTPLIIIYTPETFPESSVKALEAEGKYSNAIPYPAEHLRLPKGNATDEEGMVAERFIDTWTKLRVFDILEVQGKPIDRLCFLDADMMIFSNPTPHIFNAANDEYLRGYTGMRICAAHICVCNLDGDKWAPDTWTPQNCSLTHLTSPSEIGPVKSDPPTMGQFNSGTFVFRPSPSMRDFVLGRFASDDPKDLRRLKFPDQDFLNLVFDGRWKSLSWKTNALKTWRYWHPNVWRDDDVAVLHYIVDKPWAARVQQGDGGKPVAGYKGDDGETHSWWWSNFERWRQEREDAGETLLLEEVDKRIASADGTASEDMKAIGGGAQDYAKKWDGEAKDSADAVGKEDEGSHGPVLRKKMLGERGHGPVVRN